MAPEELTLGATINQATTVFTLGRLITHFATRLTDDLADFIGSRRSAGALRRACEVDPSDRFPTVERFAAAWAAGR
jgi:serine/threonine-protein kinase